MSMIWFRIDNRLIHGQIIETWLPYTRATRLVVCNGELARDDLRQQIMMLAVPSRITVDFTAPASLNQLLHARHEQDERVLVIFADCADAQAARNAGVQFTMLNIGNMHYAPGKQQVCGHAAFSQEDSDCLRSFSELGINLDFRCVPNDTTEVTEW
ncbi:PTS system sorbose subIIB component family protein [uncultured delta proteobacterium]|uniref:PTS system sorbose subIIB component family protein n=1 Tax=uncultured delta proteobacterium TaxID=34034 RepID=A0A212J722_9DELT|nr:PTS system sorbose subIIB component family protein [uncultured delta proteobacterium]